MALPPLTQIASKGDFDNFIKGNDLCVLHFSANWMAACEQVSPILAELQKLYSFRGGVVEAEDVPEVSFMCKITAAPTLVYFKNGLEVDRVNGYNPPEMRNRIMLHTIGGSSVQSEGRKEELKENLNGKLKRLINKCPLMLFMKGSTSDPKCGFSRQIMEILREANADFGTFDILSDEEVRQGLKEYSNWPTYPQLYLHGELVGGLDVVREEMNDPSFVSRLPRKESLNDKLKRLTTSARLMLFMKGTPNEPRCGFSRQTVELLRNINADFSSFDILSDEEVRQGLKEYSNWPTYPQIYLDGELIGGLDVLREELGDSEFVGKLPKTA